MCFNDVVDDDKCHCDDDSMTSRCHFDVTCLEIRLQAGDIKVTSK